MVAAAKHPMICALVHAVAIDWGSRCTPWWHLVCDSPPHSCVRAPPTFRPYIYAHSHGIYSTIAPFQSLWDPSKNCPDSRTAHRATKPSTLRGSMFRALLRHWKASTCWPFLKCSMPSATELIVFLSFENYTCFVRVLKRSAMNLYGQLYINILMHVNYNVLHSRLAAQHHNNW